MNKYKTLVFLEDHGFCYVSRNLLELGDRITSLTAMIDRLHGMASGSYGDFVLEDMKELIKWIKDKLTNNWRKHPDNNPDKEYGELVKNLGFAAIKRAENLIKDLEEQQCTQHNN